MEKIDMGLDDIIKMKQKRQAKPKGQRFRSGSVTGSGTGAYGMQSTRLRQQNVNNKFNFRSQYNRVAKNQPTVAMYKNQSKYTSNKSYALQGTRPQLMNTRKMTQGTRYGGFK
ncbi:PREDICTED: uncharacterized protein LOC106818479 [Priapulus caudatus]|uniref:Uncharacterized protein LOC106818479 n=1 Tax=Priapulus caudatus TaxID=37621 RepID=A0ABM1F2J6_PRICU|nr:PREDICTED: uncharacterized protein LOC106818479 [Priapulus caudatus]